MPAVSDPIGGTPLPIWDGASRPRRVVFVGVDAGRYDYLERFHVPNIERLIRRGVCYRNAVCGNFISETAPGFASLSTGVYAKTHGICTSYEWFDQKTGTPQYFYDEQTGQLRLDAISLGELWKRSSPGVKIAAISTEDRPSLLLAGPAADTVVYCYNEIMTTRAQGEHYKGRGVNAEHFTWTERPTREVPPYLAGIRIPRRTDWLEDSIRHLNQDIADVPAIDRHIMDAALKVLDAEQPELFFITLVCVNIVGHLYGTASPEIRAAVEETDRQIGRLIDQLEARGWVDDTLIVVASDHGMTDRPHSVDVLTNLVETPDVAANVAHYLPGASGGLYLHDTSLGALERALAAVKNIRNVRDAWARDESMAPWFVRRFAHERCPDILILAERTYQLVPKGWAKPSVPAHHGPPYLSDLNIWTVFSGAGVKPLGRIGEPLDLFSDEPLDELKRRRSQNRSISIPLFELSADFNLQ
jgi:predicted AlkP superfamily pyrophosphatase or phosphodiesterase